MNESGTPLLVIPNPDAGRGHAYFPRKDVAAQIRFPARRMLREESQRSIRAARKKKWAEFRLAKESTSGKPHATKAARIAGTLTMARNELWEIAQRPLGIPL